MVLLVWFTAGCWIGGGEEGDCEVAALGDKRGSDKSLTVRRILCVQW
jgi:hypothetical protein